MKKRLKLPYCNIIYLLYLLWPIHLNGQDVMGIKFINANSLAEVLQKARLEKKYIFIDAYATWCGPCKKMDHDVYVSDSAGNAINSRFIAIKVQMDKKKTDDSNTVAWYKDVDQLADKYKIKAFPSYVFLSSNGELIMIEKGYKSVKDFVLMVSNVLNPKLNFTNNLNLFNQGKLDQQETLNLAMIANEYKQDSIAFKIANSYKWNYLDAKIPSKTLIEHHHDFIAAFTDIFKADDPISLFIYKYKSDVDSAINRKGFSEIFTDYMIYKKYFSYLFREDSSLGNQAVQWENLQTGISRNYDAKTAKKTILENKIKYYNYIKDWDNAIKYEIEQIDLDRPDTSSGFAIMGLNNFVFESIFKHSNNVKYLKKGLQYMELVVQVSPSYSHIDTYANILYKLGMRQKALKQEKKALTMATEKNDKKSMDLFKETIERMINNEPTWPTKKSSFNQ